jgi:hypothetical protein
MHAKVFIAAATPLPAGWAPAQREGGQLGIPQVHHGKARATYKGRWQERALCWKVKKPEPHRLLLRHWGGNRCSQKSMNCSLTNSPSSVCCVIDQGWKHIYAFNAQLLVLCRRQVRPSWSAFLKSPTCVLSAKCVTVMPKAGQIGRECAQEATRMGTFHSQKRFFFSSS